MSDISLTKFEQDNLELYIDESTGLAYAHHGAMARMFGIEGSAETLRRQLKTASSFEVKEAEILTASGKRTASLYPASVVFRMAMKFAPALAEQMGAAGANVFMCGLAGYQVSVVAKPKTALELAKEQVKLLEQIELQSIQIQQLEQETERQSEIIDELYEYSSIIRIAKFNNCDEKAFNWRKLRAASKVTKREIKEAPCPRFGKKNLYHHDAWRFVYPAYKLPETTTLMIKSSSCSFLT